MMNLSSPVVAIAPLIGLAFNCCIHIVVSRAMRLRSPYPALAVGAATEVVVTGLLTLFGCREGSMSRIDTTALLVMNLVASFALAFCYFNFVNLIVASLRVRILVEIADAGGRMHRATLLNRYGSGNVADVRLTRLVDGGHFVERNGRLYSGRLHFLVVARIFDVLRVLIFGRRQSAAIGNPLRPAASDDGFCR